MYHVKPKDRMVATYSRDEVTAPLRMLAETYDRIRKGLLGPDGTRSGAIVPPEQAKPLVESSLPTFPSSSSDTSSGHATFSDTEDPLEGSTRARALLPVALSMKTLGRFILTTTTRWLVGG